MRKLVVGLLVIVVGSLLTVNVGEASPPFVLFGDAVEVKAGTGGNPWAVELSSRCLPSYPSCFRGGGDVHVLWDRISAHREHPDVRRPLLVEH